MTRRRRIDLPAGTVHYREVGPGRGRRSCSCTASSSTARCGPTCRSRLAARGLRLPARPPGRSGSHTAAMRDGADLSPRGVARVGAVVPRGARPRRRRARRQRHRGSGVPARCSTRTRPHRPAGAHQLRRLRHLPAVPVRPAVPARAAPARGPGGAAVDAARRGCAPAGSGFGWLVHRRLAAAETLRLGRRRTSPTPAYAATWRPSPAAGRRPTWPTSADLAAGLRAAGAARAGRAADRSSPSRSPTGWLATFPDARLVERRRRPHLRRARPAGAARRRDRRLRPSSAAAHGSTPDRRGDLRLGRHADAVARHRLPRRVAGAGPGRRRRRPRRRGLARAAAPRRRRRLGTQPRPPAERDRRRPVRRGRASTTTPSCSRPTTTSGSRTPPPTPRCGRCGRACTSAGIKVGVLSNTIWPRAVHEGFFERDGVLAPRRRRRLHQRDPVDQAVAARLRAPRWTPSAPPTRPAASTSATGSSTTSGARRTPASGRSTCRTAPSRPSRSATPRASPTPSSRPCSRSCAIVDGWR